MDEKVEFIIARSHRSSEQTEVFRNGQSLIEVLIAVAIGVIMVAAVTTLIASTLRVSSQTQRTQTSVALGKELLENVRVWTEKDWHGIASMSTGSLNHYYLNASSSPFSLASGDESVTVGSTAYTRYFYVDDVTRDGSGRIAPGIVDPSTKIVSAISQWPQSATATLTSYVTRSLNYILDQTDWSGGPNQSGPATTTNNRFATSSNIDYATTTGSIILFGF